MDTLTSMAVAALVGAVVSFLLATSPKLAGWWAKVEHKREIMLGVFVAAPLVILGLSCGSIYLVEYTCPAGAFQTPQFYVENIVLGLTAFAGSQWGFVNGARYFNQKQ